jgi:hypothetical protein
MGRLQIATFSLLAGSLASPASGAPVATHLSASVIVSAKVTCPKWCGQWETKWVTKPNGITTKTKQCKFWVSSCTDDGR